MIRLATVDDLDSLVEIFEGAKVFMWSVGNLDQWTGGYPAREDLLEDIHKNHLYVMDDGEIYGAFALVEEPEPTYAYIDGAWANDGPYLTIHRLAKISGRRGVFKEAVDFAIKKCPCVRVDTHRDNLPMQGAIVNYGFIYRGKIYLKNGDERLAYDYVKI